MSIATIWNKESTNYGENAFVRQNGTGTIEVKNEKEMMTLISEAVHNLHIQRLDLLLGTGRIVWSRNVQPIHGFCECGGCYECNDDVMESFEPDIEDDCDDDVDFDFNDPRR